MRRLLSIIDDWFFSLLFVSSLLFALVIMILCIIVQVHHLIRLFQ